MRFQCNALRFVCYIHRCKIKKFIFFKFRLKVNKVAESFFFLINIPYTFHKQLFRIFSTTAMPNLRYDYKIMLLQKGLNDKLKNIQGAFFCFIYKINYVLWLWWFLYDSILRWFYNGNFSPCELCGPWASLLIIPKKTIASGQ